MRRRLRKFLPIVLIALVVQILAPIAACWAAVVAASDPLYAAEICHDSAGSAASQTGNPAGQTGDHVHDGVCCLSCAAHTAASLDSPQPTTVAAPYRQPERVVWQDRALHLSDSRAGSNAQARGPPSVS